MDRTLETDALQYGTVRSVHLPVRSDGAIASGPRRYYTYANGVMRNGMIVAAFQAHTPSLPPFSPLSRAHLSLVQYP